MTEQTQQAVLKATALMLLAQQFGFLEDLKAAFGENFGEKVANASLEIGLTIPAEEQEKHFSATIVAAMKESLDQIEG